MFKMLAQLRTRADKCTHNENLGQFGLLLTFYLQSTDNRCEWLHTIGSRHGCHQCIYPESWETNKSRWKMHNDEFSVFGNRI